MRRLRIDPESKTYRIEHNWFPNSTRFVTVGLDVETHREYFKDRTVIFCENMTPGKYTFVISLLPRFTGKYIINPAQVSLMYVPVVNANTDMKIVRVNDEAFNLDAEHHGVVNNCWIM